MNITSRYVYRRYIHIIDIFDVQVTTSSLVIYVCSSYLGLYINPSSTASSSTTYTAGANHSARIVEDTYIINTYMYITSYPLYIVDLRGSVIGALSDDTRVMRNEADMIRKTSLQVITDLKVLLECNVVLLDSERQLAEQQLGVFSRSPKTDPRRDDQGIHCEH